MTPKQKQEHKDSLDNALALLMEFRVALDRPIVEPGTLCSHCGQVFETLSKVIKHVSVCEKNPLVQKIERLQALVKAAFREAGELAFKDNMFDEDNYCWDHSKAREGLEK